MDAIENAAYVSVGRACGFAGLGIFCIMFGLSYAPDQAARAGGILCLGVAVICVFRGYMARSRPYKKTELWIILPKDMRPPEGLAQRLVGNALRTAYYWFAESAATIAFVLFICSIFLDIADVNIWRDADTSWSGNLNVIPLTAGRGGIVP